MAASPLNPFDAKKIGSTVSPGPGIAEDFTARTRRTFGGRPVHRPNKKTPLLWLMKGIFTPLTRKEEAGIDVREIKQPNTTSIFSRESAIGHTGTAPKTQTTITKPIAAKNVVWNRTVFEFAQTLSSFDFSPEKFNVFLCHASRLLCDNPTQNTQLNPALANALIGELSRLTTQDRETVLTNILTFQNDLLRTAKESGPLYETSSKGLIPKGQFANLVDQMLTLGITALNPKPQAEPNE